MVFFWGRTDLLHKNLSAYRLHVTTNLSEKEKRRSSVGSGGRASLGGGGGDSGLLEKRKADARVLHYWCFSPGLAMEQLMELQVTFSYYLSTYILSPFTVCMVRAYLKQTNKHTYKTNNPTGALHPPDQRDALPPRLLRRRAPHPLPRAPRERSACV